MSDRLAGLLLWPLADVSIRWGLLILALAAWFAIRPPRRAATRHLLCVAAMLVGPALMLTPRWDAYVYGVRPTAAADFAPIPAPDFSQMRPLTPAQVEAIEARVASEARSTPPRPAAPVDWPGVAAKAAVAAWLAGTLLMLARLGLGVRAMRRWARRATPATADDLARLDACRTALPTSRPVRLMRHPEAAAPVMVGGRRPTIMIPPDWDAWPADRRRAALAHELAHVRRYDDASKLLEELVRVPMWFHPAVAWLLARLDRERELLCDEAAVAAGDDPKGLARLLLDLSRSPSPRRLPSASLPFLTRRTTAVRIRRLLEDDMPRTLSRPSLARTLLLGPTALAALLALGTPRVRPASAQDASAPLKGFADIVARLDEAPAGRLMVGVGSEEPAASPPTSEQKPIEGTIVDADGKPIAGATVLVDADSGRRTLTTDDAGRYSIPGEVGNVRLYASKPGYTPASVLGVSARDEESRRTIRLVRPAVFSGVLVDEADRPIVGATVRVDQTDSTSPAVIAGPWKYRSHSYRFPPEGTKGTEFERLLTATTDDDGAFVLPEAAEDGAWIRFEITDAGGRRRLLRRPERQARGGTKEQSGFVKVGDGVRRRLVTLEGAKIEGRVVSRVPGLDLSKLSVQIRPSASAPNFRESFDRRPVWARIDAEGRFSLEGLDLGLVDVEATGFGARKSWICRPARRVDLVNGLTATATVEVIPGVEVVGKVVSERTGGPIAEAMIQIEDVAEGGDGSRSLILQTDAAGRYSCRLLAGRTYPVSLQALPAGYRASKWSQSLSVPEGATTFDGPTFQVSDSGPISGRLLDADGRPIAGARVEFLTIAPPPANERPSSRTDDGGAFHLPAVPGLGEPGKPIALWIELKDGRKFKADAAPDAAGEYVVKFAPDAAGGLKGAVVDPDGKPVAGANVFIRVEDPKTFEPLRWWSARSGEDGGFAWEGAKGVGRVTLIVSAPGFVQAERRDVRVPTDALKITLEAPREFRGVLVDPKGRPIAGARVRIEQSFPHLTGEGKDGATFQGVAVGTFSSSTTEGESSFTFSAFTPPSEVETAADGSFAVPSALNSPRMALKLRATRDGRPLAPLSPPRQKARVFNGLIVVDAGERPEIVVGPGGRVEGRVVSQVDGLDPATLTATARGPRGDVVSAPVDGEGRFVLEGMDEGECHVGLRGPGEGRDWTWIRPTPRALESGKAAAVVVEVVRGVEVRGRVVVRGTDEPAPGVGVAITPGREAARPSTVATADADGRYALRLPPGAAILSFHRPAEQFAGLQVQPERRLEIPEAATFEAPDVEAERAVTIHGRVVDARGAAVAGATLIVSGSTRPAPAESSVAVFAPTKGDGSFRFRPGAATVPPGEEVQLHVMTDGRASRVAVAPDAEGRVEVVLPSPSE
ncbi:MAG: hypothetical protein BGO49_01785 [Planctomycetales bacterium 71-10]|nr:MAG: hypothetical protein BGO49_01785 [Planctomycetales bacterium 71-10]